MSALTVASKFTAIDKFSSPIRKMSSNLRSFTKKAEINVARLDRSLRRITPSIGGLGRQLIGFASAAVVFQGIGSAIQTMRDFEQANSDLAARMGKTVKQNTLLSKDAQRLGAITAKTATEVVGLQESFAALGFTMPQIINMTESTISGSIAMNAELAETAELTGAMVKTFDAFGSIDAPQILDQLTLATQKSALNFEKLQTALPIVAGAANAAGVPFTTLLSLLGKLSDSGIDASSSATSLRNIFIESKKQGLDYSTILEKIGKSQDKLTAANNEFGKRAAVSAVILAKNIKETKELEQVLNLAAKGQELSGVAAKAAAERLNNLNGSITLLSSAWDAMILRTDDGTGAVNKFRRVIDFTKNNLETIVTVIASVIGLFIALKTIVFLSTTAFAAINIGIGIYNALFTRTLVLTNANVLAQKAYIITSKIAVVFLNAWAAAQAALNVIMTANPIGAIIVAVLALIALVIVIIKKWDEWGAALSILLGPLGLIISLIVSFRRNWDMIKDAFESGGILSGLRAIGKVILDSLLMPIQQLLELIAKIPGLGGASGFANSIFEFRKTLGVEVESDESRSSPLINPKAAEQSALTEKIEKITTTNATLTILDKENRTSIEADSQFMPVIKTTLGVGQ